MANEPFRPWHFPPDWWVIGPLLEYGTCSECGAELVRYWDADDFFCARCGLLL